MQAKCDASSQETSIPILIQIGLENGLGKAPLFQLHWHSLQFLLKSLSWRVVANLHSQSFWGVNLFQWFRILNHDKCWLCSMLLNYWFWCCCCWVTRSHCKTILSCIWKKSKKQFENLNLFAKIIKAQFVVLEFFQGVKHMLCESRNARETKSFSTSDIQFLACLCIPGTQCLDPQDSSFLPIIGSL